MPWVPWSAKGTTEAPFLSLWTLWTALIVAASHIDQGRAAQWVFKQLLLLNISNFCAVFWFPNEKMAKLSCRENVTHVWSTFLLLQTATNLYITISHLFSVELNLFIVALCPSMNKTILWNWLSWTCHKENLLKAHSCASLRQVRKKFDHFKYNNSSEIVHLLSLPTAYVLNYLSREQQQRSPDLRLPSHFF